ncbi:hypothetical protein [Amycolatopsis sp. GM8]|nr:hypothetical protein [Amycolatopsis sp. GM8]
MTEQPEPPPSVRAFRLGLAAVAIIVFAGLVYLAVLLVLWYLR